MAGDYTWVDNAWWRDWIVWVGVVGATANLVGLVVRDNRPWWALPLGWLVTFGFTIAVLGFFRTVVRTYRSG